MRQAWDQSTAEVERTLELELTLVSDAIAMVASGASPRVVIASLRFGKALVATASGLATEAGVRVVPLRRPDGTGTDIAVEGLSDA